MTANVNTASRQNAATAAGSAAASAEAAPSAEGAPSPASDLIVVRNLTVDFPAAGAGRRKTRDARTAEKAAGNGRTDGEATAEARTGDEATGSRAGDDRTAGTDSRPGGDRTAGTDSRPGAKSAGAGSAAATRTGEEVTGEGRTADVPDVPADGWIRAVDGLSFALAPGRALGIVGESGSGKSTVAGALLGLQRGTGARVSGSVRVAGTDVLTAPGPALRRLRGGTAAMVFQDPLSALDPYLAIGDQIAEVHRTHAPKVSRRAARERAVAVLDRVGIPDAVRRARARPHEFSGGMRQRALIAMALACEPELLVADEPTTALDVTVQAQILDLLHELRAETGMGLVLVSHDLGVVAGSVDDMLVMREGRAVEEGGVAQLLAAPVAPYTRDLLAAVPRLTAPRTRERPAPAAPTVCSAPSVPFAPSTPSVPAAPAAPSTPATPSAPSATSAPSAPEATPLLAATDLRRTFGRGKDRKAAVDGVSVTVAEGETLGVVGESGSGKTTLGRMLVGLLRPDAGALRYRGEPLRGVRPDLQMVFQDPVSSLNPRRGIGESVADPLRAAGAGTDREITARARELLGLVGLDPAWYHRYPHEFSGGQRQRVGIARALAPGPKVLICDEPVSALDVTTQAQVLDLLARLQRELGLGLVLIAHDLAVVRQAADRVAVVHQGRVVEHGPVDTVYDTPAEPYTRRLLAAVPVLDPVEAARRRAARAAPGPRLG